jgi:hypothetical protein
MKNFSRKEFRNFRIGYTDKNATNTNMPAETWQPQYRACCLSSGIMSKNYNSLDAHVETCLH